jgi:hypothetical protein
MSSITTHSAQHPHLCYTYLILVLTLNRPALRTIQHRRSDCCPIEISFQLKWYFLIAQNTRGASPFQPPNLNMMAYIYFYLSAILYYRPKLFKSCNLGYDMISNFHLQGRPTSPFVEVTIYILCFASTQVETIRF